MTGSNTIIIDVLNNPPDFDLPPCRYRRSTEYNKNHCSSLFIIPGEDGTVSNETCLECPYADRIPSEEVHKLLTRSISLPCTFLGQPTGETISCPSCNGSVKIKTFVCGLHGTCTLNKQVPGIKTCRCVDYRRKGG